MVSQFQLVVAFGRIRIMKAVTVKISLCGVFSMFVIITVHHYLSL